jgi:hypothetical protein
MSGERLGNEELLSADTKDPSNRQITQRNRISKKHVSATENTKEALELSICESNKEVGKKPKLLDDSGRSKNNIGMVNKWEDIAIGPPDEKESGMRFYYLKCPKCDKKCMHVTSISRLTFDGEMYREKLGKYDVTPFEKRVSNNVLKNMIEEISFKGKKYKCSNCKEENKMEWGKCSRNKGMFDKGDPCKGAIKGYNTVILREMYKDTSSGYCTQCGTRP